MTLNYTVEPHTLGRTITWSDPDGDWEISVDITYGTSLPTSPLFRDLAENFWQNIGHAIAEYESPLAND